MRRLSASALIYEGQLESKRDIVLQAFERHSSLKKVEEKTRQTIGMEDPWGYRNKSQFQVGVDKQKVIAWFVWTGFSST